MRVVLRIVAGLGLVLGAGGCRPEGEVTAARPALVAGDWRTRAERTDYVETARYAEIVEYCRHLAEAAPYATFTTFGTSGEGRALPLLILSRDASCAPRTAHQGDKAVVLVQCCIHAGECEGKDASLALAREIVITQERISLLDHINLLIIPIFNVDGHERFGAHGRINQNGPREMGWRTNATNLNLNRDYMKADTPEMRAWLKLWTTWQPDVFIDTHTTDGEDHRYDVLYNLSDGPEVATPVATWVRQVLSPGLLPALEAEGYATLPYAWLRNRKDPSLGLVAMGPMLPRLSDGYGAVCNRPTVLVETHALNPYARRVQATHATLRLALETVNANVQTLQAAVRQADELARALRGAARDGRVPLMFDRAEQPRRITYRGYEMQIHASEISGNEVIEYLKQPRDYETGLYERTRLALAITPPLAYLIPPQWTDVIARLDLHGIRHFRTQTAQTLDVSGYRFENVAFEPLPHEGRMIPKFKVATTQERREFSAGTVVVPTDQPRARLIAHLLEPEAPDSFVAWGFFNAIFEVKEYAEPYALEPLARKMLADDPALKQEFERKLATEEEFARDPQARLRFFYERSAYWDRQHSLYPIARLNDAAALGRLRTE